MNVRLRKTFLWSSCVVYQDTFSINDYTAILNLVTNTDDHEQQNIAYERMKFWMHDVLTDAILINDQDPHLDAWESTGARVIALPEEPVDQVIGLMLFSKLNAICQDRLVITDVDLMSSKGDGMRYLHNFNESVGPFIEDNWWKDCKPVWFQNKKHAKNSKVVNLARVPDWKDLDLEWAAGPDLEPSVVFADFSKDAKK